MTNSFINDPGYEVPENKILVIPHKSKGLTYYEEVIVPLKGMVKREWFTQYAYYCLPLTVANQYGFLIKSLRDFSISWDGTTNNAHIEFLNDDNQEKQTIQSTFGSGIVTVQNRFALKTPPGINLMTIQPPNLFIPGCFSLSGVIECDNLRRDFTFNFKITVPNIKIDIKKGDPLGAFIPIPRYFIDQFDVENVYDYFDEDIVNNDIDESWKLSTERITVDIEKPHNRGKRYFGGIHTDGTKYPDHQRRVK